MALAFEARNQAVSYLPWSRAPRGPHVRCGAIGDGARSRSGSTPSSPAADIQETQQALTGRRLSTEAVRTTRVRASTAASANVATSSAVVKANRSIRALRAEGRRADGENRLPAFASALALLTLAWYGQDLVSQLGSVTGLPIDEIDGVIYFVICFNVVSLVLPRSRYKL